MKTIARRRPAVSIALAAALLTAFLITLSPLSASAHDSLVSSSPEADSTVQVLPSELTFTFSAELIDAAGATEVVVTDPAGAPVTDGAPTVSGAVVTQPLAAEAPAGLYQVVWKVVSSDGHPTSGEFSFTVTESTVAEPTAQPSPSASPTPSATSDLIATPDPTATAPTDQDDSSGTAWIWAVSIAGLLVAVCGLVTAVMLSRRRRGTGDEAASDDPADR